MFTTYGSKIWFLACWGLGVVEKALIRAGVLEGHGDVWRRGFDGVVWRVMIGRQAEIAGILRVHLCILVLTQDKIRVEVWRLSRIVVSSCRRMDGTWLTCQLQWSQANAPGVRSKPEIKHWRRNQRRHCAAAGAAYSGPLFAFLALAPLSIGQQRRRADAEAWIHVPPQRQSMAGVLLFFDLVGHLSRRSASVITNGGGQHAPLLLHLPRKSEVPSIRDRPRMEKSTSAPRG